MKTVVTFGSLSCGILLTHAVFRDNIVAITKVRAAILRRLPADYPMTLLE